MTLLHDETFAVEVIADAEALFPEARRRARRRKAFGLAAILVVAGVGTGATIWARDGGDTRRPSAASLTPAEFLALARSGTDGTYEVLYRVSGAPMGEGTVLVAQRAPATSNAWPDRAGTMWSFRFSGSSGSDTQWIESGSVARTCWQKSASDGLTCSGPGTYEYSNGFSLSTEGFIPATTLTEINDAVNRIGLANGEHQHLQVSTQYSRSLGSLSCLRATPSGLLAGGTTIWCLNSKGVLVSEQNGDGGLLQWPQIDLVRFRPGAPRSDFTQIARSTSAGSHFHLPPL